MDSLHKTLLDTSNILDDLYSVRGNRPDFVFHLPLANPCYFMKVCNYYYTCHKFFSNQCGEWINVRLKEAFVQASEGEFVLLLDRISFARFALDQ